MTHPTIARALAAERMTELQRRADRYRLTTTARKARTRSATDRHDPTIVGRPVVARVHV